MVIGTSCRFSVRRSAVTVTSCSSVPVVAVVVSAGAAKTTAVLDAPRMAATAAEIFGFGFIATVPRGLVVIFPLELPASLGGSPLKLLYHTRKYVLVQTRHPTMTHPLFFWIA